MNMTMDMASSEELNKMSIYCEDDSLLNILKHSIKLTIIKTEIRNSIRIQQRFAESLQKLQNSFKSGIEENILYIKSALEEIKVPLSQLNGEYK
ncbi:hypothetical protein NPIL_370601 [Nephila pilipes]|uniref:Uncharacterized protein n=1 Tax=Nephila pilipes TaxID=299642 RepID=A0A8X6Q483_NEPPI|nr:hypothetical protein NPIL_370601 [Nephila pilipes]